jgi:hypothetical protein
MNPPRKAARGMPCLTALLNETVSGARDHSRLALIGAAQRAIARSPGADRLLVSYTDAIFRNTEQILAEIRAPAE